MPRIDVHLVECRPAFLHISRLVPFIETNTECHCHRMKREKREKNHMYLAAVEFQMKSILYHLTLLFVFHVEA